MFSELTCTNTINLLRMGLDAATLRHKAISNNIANVNTPKFKRQIVNFEEQLAKVYDGKVDLVGARTDDRHIPIGDTSYVDVRPEIVTDRAHVMRNDKNNVDVDIEMSDLAKNTMLYQVHTARIAAVFADLNDLISRAGRS